MYGGVKVRLPALLTSALKGDILLVTSTVLLPVEQAGRFPDLV